MNTKLLAVLSVSGLASLAGAQTFNLAGAGAIPDATINQTEGVALNMGSGPVSGTFSTISGVSASFTTPVGAVGHSWVGDLICRLSYDAGSNGSTDATIFLFNRVGQTVAGSGFGDSSDLNGTYVFQDGGGDFLAAAVAAGAAASVAPGNYAASAFNNGPQSFSGIFGGLSSSGTWTLSFTDSGGGDVGAIGAASVTITTVPTPGAAALLGLAGLTVSRRRR